LDVPEPPKIVLEQPAPCSDTQKAEETLRHALAPSLAPRPGWEVTIRFERTGNHIEAEGEITDEFGAPVAHRAMKQDSEECSPLSRAVGVWASLVLDAEVERATAPPKPEPVEAHPAARATPPTQLPDAALWPPPAPHEKPRPDAKPLLAHPEGERTIEIGATTLVMGGTGAGLVGGPSAFGVFEVGRGWFLRPTVAVARTLQAGGDTVGATWAVGRFDACGRVPGNYLEKRGMQLDFCGGGEGGVLEGSGWVMPIAAVGPSMGLRGELGGDFSAMVRAVAEVNVLRDTRAGITPDAFVGRAEVGVSWRIR
jgi:hypothetical protein